MKYRRVREFGEFIEKEMNPKTKKMMDDYYNKYISFRKEENDSAETLLEWIILMSRDYSPSTLWTAHSLIKKRILLVNGVKIVDSPSLKSYLKSLEKKKKKKKAPAFDNKDLLKFICDDEIPDIGMRIYVAFCFFGGLRFSESCYMKFNDVKIHEEGLSITINRVKSDGTNSSFRIPRKINNDYDFLSLYEK